MKMKINSDDFLVPAGKEVNHNWWPTSQSWLTLPTRAMWFSSKTVPFAMGQPERAMAIRRSIRRLRISRRRRCIRNLLPSLFGRCTRDGPIPRWEDGKASYSDQDIENVVAYLRSLQN